MFLTNLNSTHTRPGRSGVGREKILLIVPVRGVGVEGALCVSQCGEISTDLALSIANHTLEKNANCANDNIWAGNGERILRSSIAI